MRCPVCRSTRTLLVLSATSRGQCDACGTTWIWAGGQVCRVTRPREQGRPSGIRNSEVHLPPRPEQRTATPFAAERAPHRALSQHALALTEWSSGSGKS